MTIMHMASPEFMRYMCGMSDNPIRKGHDWTRDINEVTCEECIKEFMDYRRYRVLGRKLAMKRRSKEK